MSLIPRYVSLGNAQVVLKESMRVLYTDGSYDHGVAGWAVVENDACIHQGWKRGTTSNMAEGEAILAALKIIGLGTAIIISDSLSWVTALSEGRSIKGKGAGEILSRSRALIHPGIKLHWVPSHTGLEGNELADSYAREARLLRSSCLSSVQ